MRGLMAKPSGKIIETPIKANFREGLSVLEYFSSTHGARKGLADTALKTADSGYLTRKLADVAQNVVITMEDCGTTQGITKGVIYRGEKVEVSLADSIRGRVSRANIVNPITDEVIVSENEMITVDDRPQARGDGLEKIQVRSPMTCEAPLGICRRCYGMDLSTGQLVEEGMAVGHHRRPVDRRAGHAAHDAYVPHRRRRHPRRRREATSRPSASGNVKYARPQRRHQRRGQADRPDPQRRDPDPRPQGPRAGEVRRARRRRCCMVEDDQKVSRGQMLCEWDPHSIPILAEVGGKVRFEDIVEGETMRVENDPSGHIRRTDHRAQGRPAPADHHRGRRGQDPRLLLHARTGPHRSQRRPDRSRPAPLLAKTPREVGGTQDITGGLPRVTEIFEARKPKDPAVIAEIDGTRRAARTRSAAASGRSSSAARAASSASTSSRTASTCASTPATTSGPATRWSTGRSCRTTSCASRAKRPCSSTCSAKSRTSTASQRVEINDKHIEIIVAQMLRKVRVESVGDTEPAARLR